MRRGELKERVRAKRANERPAREYHHNSESLSPLSDYYRKTPAFTANFWAHVMGEPRPAKYGFHNGMWGRQ